MSILKAQFNIQQANVLLDNEFGQIENLETLKGGEASQAYAFTHKKRELVLRVNHHADYSRDVWASITIRNSIIPIPKIVKTGTYKQYYWAVSTRAAGKMLYYTPEKEINALMPQLVDILRAIHTSDISTSTGYGNVNANGNAEFKTWRDFIEQFDMLGDYIDWKKAMKDADKEYRYTIEKAWELGREMLDFLPEDRALNHGDYNLANIIAADNHITGVVDWSCIYGDHLRDVAWVDFWAPTLNFPHAYLQKYPSKNAKERIRCYQLFMGARSLGFFIHTKQSYKGSAILEQVKKLLSK